MKIRNSYRKKMKSIKAHNINSFLSSKSLGSKRLISVDAIQSLTTPPILRKIKKEEMIHLKYR
jgi:Ni,Fe-hydrogenase maturation factor